MTSNVVRRSTRIAALGVTVMLSMTLQGTRLRAAEAPVPVDGTSGAVSAQLSDGAVWEARVPTAWNGTLLLYSHGYSPQVRAPELSPRGTQDWLLEHGYALAASSYSKPGWALEQAVPDQIDVLDAFAARFGMPRQTIAWGNSMGGLVTQALIEQHPQRFDGALPSCGSIAGSLGMMNQALDGAFAFKTLLAPKSALRLVHTLDDMANAQRAQTLLRQAMGSAAGRARVALAAALAQIPTWTEAGSTPPPAGNLDAQLQQVANSFVMGVFLPRADQELRAGGSFSWNTGVNYREQLRRSGQWNWVAAYYRRAGLSLDHDLALLKAAPRLSADARAVAYMRANYVPSGALSVPTLSYHTIGDGATVPTQQQAYESAVHEHNRDNYLALGWVERAGHCNFTPAEHIAALQALQERLVSGRWLVTPTHLNELAQRTGLGPGRFTSFTSEPFLRPCRREGACEGEPGARAESKPLAHQVADYADLLKVSSYVRLGDGTDIAVDIYRPARGNVAIDTPLPVLLLHSQGPRSEPRMLDAYGVEDLVKHGYVFVWMQPRGNGASFGRTGGFLTEQNGRDVADVIAWLIRQPWCNQRVGMLGLSNLGFIQWLALQQHPFGLISIMPAVANPDFYYQLYPNGASALPQMMVQGQARAALTPPAVQPVDADSDAGHAQFEAAQASHAGSISFGEAWLPNMARDQVNAKLGYAPGLVDSPLPAGLSALKNSGVRIYQLGGWADASPGGQLIAYHAVGGRILIGDWPHMLMAQEAGGPLLRAEQRRWFDDTLKGIDTGLKNSPPVRYETIHARQGDGWHYAADFPLPSQHLQRYLLGPPGSGTVHSANDGRLQTGAAKPGIDTYHIDYGIEAFDGKFDRLVRRWNGDMAPGVDRRALTYTSAVLSTDVEVTGFPVAHLWMLSDASDVNLIVYLEEVGADGRSHFVTDGAARASHRREDEREPWSALGVPFHRSFLADLQPLEPGVPVRVDFALTPTSYVFRRGARIRLSISAAEKNTYQVPAGVDPARAATLRVLREAAHESSLELPIIAPGGHGYRGTASVSQTGRRTYQGTAEAYLSSSALYVRAGARWLRCDRDASLSSTEGSAYRCLDDMGAVLIRHGSDGRLQLMGEHLRFEGVGQ